MANEQEAERAATTNAIDPEANLARKEEAVKVALLKLKEKRDILQSVPANVLAFDSETWISSYSE